MRRIAVMCLLAGLAGCAGDAPGPGAGDPLPALELAGLDRPPLRLADLRGRVVVLNVWATWCPPCRAEMPSLQRLQAQLDPARYAVVALSVDQDANLVREFVLRYALEIPVYLDGADAAAVTALGVTGYPTTFVVAPDGRVADRVAGERVWDDAAEVARVRALHPGGT